jgi:hypothetical protein
MRLSALLLHSVVTTSFITSTFSFSSPPRNWGVSRVILSAVRPTATTTGTGVDDAVQLVKRYTHTAIEESGTEAGLDALAKLGQRCTQRHPYDFDAVRQIPFQGSLLSPQRQVFPPTTTAGFLTQVQLMEENGWLSTNPDSVDGLPSLHLNLVSNGTPLFPEAGDGEVDDFESGIQKLLSIVEPHIYNELLPTVQELMNSTDIVVSDVFLRRYGEDIAGGATRQGISAHYDVFSAVTAVIAMDDVAAKGDNGLYTTARSTDGSETSNHASLRRFFPLNSGDGVVHTWDVLHGVDVEPGIDRTSLIVWFSTKEALQMNDVETVSSSATSSLSPWLSNNPSRESNDVIQFVLGSALESASGGIVDGVESAPSTSMHHHEEDSGIKHQGKSDDNPIELYLESATHGNPFAITRLGSLCENNALSADLLKRATDILSKFDEPPASVAPLLLVDDDQNPRRSVARRFWSEGALRGNPLAQIALGDEAMALGVASGAVELRLLAATLFGLAAQQGQETASDSLSRVVSYEASLCGSQEEFMESPIVQAAQAAMAYV